MLLLCWNIQVVVEDSWVLVAACFLVVVSCVLMMASRCQVWVFKGLATYF